MTPTFEESRSTTIELISKTKVLRVPLLASEEMRPNVALAQTSKNSSKRIPSMTILPVGGFLINNLEQILRKYPDIVHVKLGVSDFYLVTNPELIKQVLVTKQRDFRKGKFLQRTKKVFGDGLLTSEGEFHHRQRQLILPAFHHDRIKAYAEIMAGKTLALTSRWTDGSIVDIHNEMMKLTMVIVAKCLFGAEIESESGSIAKDLTTTIEYFNRLSSPLALIFEKFRMNRRFEHAAGKVDELIYRLIDEQKTTAQDRNDLMSMLVHAKDVDGNRMDEKQLRDEVLILFAAGHETTANALTWTWYLLSENPSVESKLHEEVDHVLGERNIASAEDFPKLEYSMKVLTESMRMYPPAWALVRESLRQVELDGYTIPSGANVVASQYVNHHDPKYFPNPERFDPGRWNGDARNSLPKFAYYPFGGGSRSCVGEPFAWMEGVLVLAQISKEWSMRHVASHKVEMKPGITLRPRYGMKMKLERRNK